MNSSFSQGKLRECSNYAARSAKNFAKAEKTNKRQPCGRDERALGETLARELESFCDSASLESFPVNQKAYISSALLLSFLMFLTALSGVLGQCCFPLTYAVCLLFAVLSLLAFAGAFGVPSKKLESTNVFALRRCTEKAKHRLIIEANLDAPFKRHFPLRSELNFKISTFICLVFNLLFSIFALLLLFSDINFPMGEEILMLIYLPLLFPLFPLLIIRCLKSSESEPGVSDNLTGCFTACAILRFFRESSISLEHTELCVLLSGSGNVNNAGVAAFLKELEKEKAKGDVPPTTVISLRSVYDADSLSLVTKDKKTGEILKKAAEEEEITLLSEKPKYLNAPSKLLSKAQIKNALLTSLPSKAPAFFRSAADTEDKINTAAIETTIKLVSTAALLYDKK